MPQLADMAGLIAQNIWLYGGAFIIVLSVLVFVHEFGHYYVARACGVRIVSFSIGFGRELIGWNDRHGTRWKLSLLPLGGYVKMFGDVDPASARHAETVGEGDEIRAMTKHEKSVAFYSQSVAKRAAIVFAGPAINFIFAILVLSVLYATIGQPVTPPIGAGVVVGSAAAKAGFEPNDQVLAIDGKYVGRFEDIKREVLVGLDTPRDFLLQRGRTTLHVIATPEKKVDYDRFGFRHETGQLGLISPGNGIAIKTIKSIDGVSYRDPALIRTKLLDMLGTTFRLGLKDGALTGSIIVDPTIAQNKGLRDSASRNHDYLMISEGTDSAFVRHSPLSALFAAMQETYNITVGTVQAILQIFTGTRSPRELGGIVQIGAMAGSMARAGSIALITFTALLSINLGLINLFPIPMLDGGHLLFYGIETLKGSPISERIQEYAFRAGLAFIAGIMLFANLNDLVQLIF